MALDVPQTPPRLPAAGPEVHALPLPALVLDAELRAADANGAWCDATSQPLDAVLGDGWWRGVDEHHRRPLRDAIGATTPGGSGAAEHRIRCGTQARWSRWWWQRSGGHTVVCITDIEDDKARESLLWWRATHDALTGLVNRDEFAALLERALHASDRSGAPVAVLYVDLDRFKLLNDRKGHQAGDRALAAAADAIVAAIRPSDVAGRLGGDEFAVLCEGIGTGQAAEEVAARIRSAVAACRPDGHLAPLSATVGVAIARPGELRPEPIIARADRSMYRQKRRRSHQPAGSCGLDPQREQGRPGDAAALADHADLAGEVVHRVFGAALALEAVAGAADDAIASRIRAIVDDLDGLVGSARRHALAATLAQQRAQRGRGCDASPPPVMSEARARSSE
jgi:diguanylate cyclase (GGDEF)-like protein